MIIRFVAKNIFSFKDETEFNLFPNKTQRLQHHKVQIGEFEFLRYSAIYGANGAGKSNLIKSIALLKELVIEGKLKSDGDELKFRLDTSNATLPISLAIEIIVEGKTYYYAITFDDNVILNEYLAESNPKSDKLLFERTFEDNLTQIKFFNDYYKTDKEKLFVDVLQEKLIQKDELLITFLSKKYATEFKVVKIIHDWFDQTLLIIMPDAKPGGLAQFLDQKEGGKDFANKFIASLNTGITKIDVEKSVLDKLLDLDKPEKELFKKIKKSLKDDPGSLSLLTHRETGEELSIVVENDEIISKRLVASHQNSVGEEILFNLGQESDGTKRLIDYIPAFNGIVNQGQVVIIDEIERSIHPITIKEIISKLSLDENITGQLIFTTHESNLLDQKIFRPDEIWFVQKDIDGSSKFYSLSDFKIHNTIDIENGYLTGRYGGIPFLANLIEIGW